MTTARRDAWAAPLSDGRVLIGGGIDANNNILRTAEIYDPTTDTFTAVTQLMVDDLYGARATTLADGRVLIAGGATTTTAPPTTAVEVYNPATGTFTKLPGGMLVPRSFAAVVALPDGKVLIAGGTSSPTSGVQHIERSAEIFDPEDSTSQELPLSGSTELTTPRSDPIAALLPNGNVLIAGGDNGGNVPVASAELFQSAPEATAPAPGFGPTAIGTTSPLSVTITDAGAQNLDVEGFSLGGPDAGDFSVGTSTCPGIPFGFERTCTVNVRFTPSATGARVATLTLSDNEPVPLTFIIKGTGSTPAGGGNGTTPPILSKVAISPGRFRAGPGARTGSTISWSDTQVATTTLSILTPVRGRRAGSHCVALSRRNRTHRRCTRYVTLDSLIHHDREGRNTLRFNGRVDGRKLKPGRYDLVLEATRLGRSRKITRPFSIAI
jgi:hypothetical protein